MVHRLLACHEKLGSFHLEAPSPQAGEGVKKLELAPSPYPLPAGERVNSLKLIINFLPLDGGGAGWG